MCRRRPSRPVAAEWHSYTSVCLLLRRALSLSIFYSIVQLRASHNKSIDSASEWSQASAPLPLVSCGNMRDDHHYILLLNRFDIYMKPILRNRRALMMSYGLFSLTSDHRCELGVEIFDSASFVVRILSNEFACDVQTRKIAVSICGKSFVD